MPRGRPKATPALHQFETSIADAELLVALAQALTSKRRRNMRSERRTRVAEAFDVRKSEYGRLALVESDDLWVVFKPAATLLPAQLQDTSPLLRPAIVSACAALETFVADTAIAELKRVFNVNDAPSRFRDIPFTVGQWLLVEDKFKRTKWGVRRIVEDWLRKNASTAPSKIGEVLSTVGLNNGWSKSVDRLRQVSPGSTERQLAAITERRNAIAHRSDWTGSKQKAISVSETVEFITFVRSVATALDQHCAAQRNMRSL